MIPVQSPCGGDRWCDAGRRQGLLWTLCALDGHLSVPSMFSSWVHDPRGAFYHLIPKELRGRPAATVGEAALLGHHLWIRCQTCRHVAVILPAVMARIVRLDCGLNALARRMRCTQCESRRVAVRAVEPGER